MDAEVAGMQRERPDGIDDESDELDPRVEVSSCCKKPLSFQFLIFYFRYLQQFYFITVYSN